MTGSGLQLRGISVRYRADGAVVSALDGVDLSLRPGAALAVTGRSGSGKSTLLGVMSGLERPAAGQVLFDDADIAGQSRRARSDFRRRELGLVIQADNLLPYLSLRENIELRLSLRGDRDGHRVTAMLGRLDVADVAESLPDQLSGGQRARGAIAMALVHQPRIILADEPTGPLDPLNAELVVDILLEEQSRLGAILVVVTHSPAAAARFPASVHLCDGRIDQPPARIEGI